MFNRWKAYPKNIPNKRGWYICSIKYGNEPGQSYVMDLFWDDIHKIWKDNRRINVFQEYEVYGYEYGTERKRLYYDNLCERDDVIAYKRYPRIYKR